MTGSPVNRLGNLTLVTQLLNSALSNVAWRSLDGQPNGKRDELKRRSLLLINQSLCDHDEWNEALIDERAADLAQRVMRTWPGLDAESWPAAEGSAAGP